jgi:hypothetical protein
VVDEEVEKPAWACPQEEAPRHIADANEPSTCGEALDLLHRPSGSLRADEDLAAPMKGWARDGARDFSDAHDCLWPLVPGIVPAVHTADNPDGEAT